MQYSLHDIEYENLQSLTEDYIKISDYNMDMLESDLWNRCHINYLNSSQYNQYTIDSLIDASSTIDVYMNQFSINYLKKLDEYNNIASRIMSYIDAIIDSKTAWINQSQLAKWIMTTNLVSQIDYIGMNVANALSIRENSVQKVKKHIELNVQLRSKNDIVDTIEFYSEDQFVHVSLSKESVEKLESHSNMFKSVFFVLSNMDEYLNSESDLKLQSKIVSLTIGSLSNKRLQLQQDAKITFRHLVSIVDN
ncbi:unnamed protein product [Didymodactylos carnosus]|uniref:Uncharacterized protein n=1 Tax=Didymodactylos carnosus TaxID=1234261 RepID=A0A8S2FG26_9BILA|nr:unnamed protein product [Didymodactylos carnosus]CAF4248791.1 unnamed protein product [Didymodactylos carnosus]